MRHQKLGVSYFLSSSPRNREIDYEQSLSSFRTEVEALKEHTSESEIRLPRGNVTRVS